MHKSLQRIRERKLANFIEWGPASIQVHPCSPRETKRGFMLHRADLMAVTAQALYRTDTRSKRLHHRDRCRYKRRADCQRLEEG